METKIAVSKKDNDVPKDFECSICGDIFDKAVSLKACGHTYCSVCIRNHWVTTSRPGVHRQSKKECPLCRTPVGHDVNKALVVNREIQQAVNAFKPAPLSLPAPSTKIGYNTNEPPIKKRIQSRNYAGMQRNGKKELQRICKEYNLAMSGNEQELVDRLRCFECMWNAELDTIDTPSTPSELAAKFKKKERMLREERSRDVMTGKINDAKYMKKLTSSLLDDENKRNDKSVSATSSGNATFDAKFKSNFAELIAQGRRRMINESYCCSSRRKGASLRTYDDDSIHDGPKKNANINASCDDESTKNSVEQTPGAGDSTKIEPSVVDQLSPKKKMHVLYNPYKSEKKRKLQNTSFAIGSHVPNKPRTSTQPRPSQSPTETTIYNPYKKKPSTGSITVNNMSSGKFDSAASLSQSSQYNIQKSRSGEIKCRDRIPLGRAINLSLNTNVYGNKINESKNPRVWSNATEMNSSINPAQKKNIHNPYK